MTKTMKTKDIHNLADLRQAKKELKLKMARADEEAKNGFLYSTVNKLFSKVEDHSAVQNTTVGAGVSSALNFVSNQAQNRFNMGKTAKTVLSIAVVIAAPIIAKKVQELIDEKL